MAKAELAMDGGSSRELGAKLRAAARDNLLGDARATFRSGEPRASLDGAHAPIDAYVRMVADRLASGGRDLGHEGVRVPFITKRIGNDEYAVIELESLVAKASDDDDGCGGGGGGFDDAEEEMVSVYHPHSLVHLQSGDVFSLNPDGSPDASEGVRASATQPASLDAALGQTGLLRFFGGSVCEYVLGLGVDVDAASAFGETALLQAARLAHVELCRWLVVDAGADANRCTLAGASALMLAAESGSEEHIEILQMLVQSGAGVNHANAWGASALHVAAFRGSTHVAKVLLELGADKALTDAKGKTPLDYAHEDTCYRGSDNKLHYSADLEALLAV